MGLKEKRLENDIFFSAPPIVGGVTFLYLRKIKKYEFPIRRQTRC